MTKTSIILFWLLLYIFGVSLIIVVLYTIRNKTRKKLEKELIELEVKKNNIINASILTEFKKLESLINNDYLQNLYHKWQKEFKAVDENIPNITDDLVEIETLLVDNKFKEAAFEIAKVEMNISIMTSEIETLLNKIEDITYSEERNREKVTKLKTVYREAITKFNNNKNNFGSLVETIELQFENIDKLFGAFEQAIDKREFENVGKIVRGLNDLVKNLIVVIDETPTVLLLSNVVLPKKINDIEDVYNRLKKDGYNLDYLNLEYNIEESKKNITDVLDRLNVLNLEDSVFILKTMLDYYESLFKDFDNEKRSKKHYYKLISVVNDKLMRLTLVVKNIYVELNKMKEAYKISDKEIDQIEDIRKNLVVCKDKYKIFSDRSRIKDVPFSKLGKEGENILIKLNQIEGNVENVLKGLGSLKEDELRAREELSRIREIINESRVKIKSYKLPVIPRKYNIELEESLFALKEISKELDMRPIKIDILNTRVETGRDLCFKVYNTANELVKTCAMSEMAIVYANRYRTNNPQICDGIRKSEREFWEGNYRKSLEIILNALNIVEPGIHSKLLKAYEEK